MIMATNPYAVPQGNQPPDYSEQFDPAYAVPDQLGPYDRPGDPYATPLKEQIGGTPDPQRLQDAPIRSYRINPQDQYSMYEAYEAVHDQNEAAAGYNVRHAYTIDVDPSAALGANRWAQRPGATPPQPDRVTSQRSQSTFRFQRNMTGNTPYRFTGAHASMASLQNNNQQMFGMQPASVRRTTQRLDLVSQPTIMDVSRQTQYPGAVVSQEQTQPSSRAYRLG